MIFILKAVSPIVAPRATPWGQVDKNKRRRTRLGAPALPYRYYYIAKKLIPIRG